MPTEREVYEQANAFLRDNSVNHDRPEVDLSQAGLDSLRRRTLAQTLPDDAAFALARDGGPIYLDEVLALIDRVARLQDGLTRIKQQTHASDCILLDDAWLITACVCHATIAQDTLSRD